MFSTAAIDGDKLDEREVLLTTTTLIMAGVESLGGFMAMFGLNLADHDEARRAVAANPGLLPDAIEESLRFNTSAQRFRRRLQKDVTLHGQTMKAGDFVCLAYGSGNRDERQYPDPDTYDIYRKPRDHLGFGGGVHACLGTQVARLATRIAFEEFHKVGAGLSPRPQRTQVDALLHLPQSARTRDGRMSADRNRQPVPGTTIFDGVQAQRGYALNKMSYSFNEAANRAAFLADEDAYCARFGLDAGQREAVRRRDVLALIEAGGNVYYLAKLAGIFRPGHAGHRRAADRHDQGSLQGQAGRVGPGRETWQDACDIVGTITTSHVPADRRRHRPRHCRRIPIGSRSSTASRRCTTGWPKPGPMWPSSFTTTTA